MMIKTSIEKLSASIGFDIGCSDDVVQGDLLNGLCSGLLRSITNKRDLDMQLCYISQKLTPESSELIKRLTEFISEEKS
jgi:hypothetical protein